MTKTLLIACTLMMAGSVYADPGAPEVIAVGTAAVACKGSEAAGKTSCSQGGVEDSVADGSTPAPAT